MKVVKNAIDRRNWKVSVAVIRKTRDGHILVEVGGANAMTEAKTLRSVGPNKVGDRVGKVTKLSSWAVTKFLDVDLTADEG